MTYFPDFLKPEGLEYWQKVKDEYIEKYSKDEHKATVEIMKEIGSPTNVISMVSRIGFPSLCDISGSDDTSTKIVFYGDSRVDPHGVVSYDERMEEGKKRYQNRSGTLPDKEREVYVACGKDIEKQIFAKCKIKPEDINNDTVASILAELKNFVIK